MSNDCHLHYINISIVNSHWLSPSFHRFSFLKSMRIQFLLFRVPTFAGSKYLGIAGQNLFLSCQDLHTHKKIVFQESSSSTALTEPLRKRGELDAIVPASISDLMEETDVMLSLLPR
ncbi:hypothetical protein OUZ56_028320 [Daphnia magna]|uniref:Uncharacterized protein n=1 Tax=Daphnia magna TaxID=35525 RepID=A0ABR0B434_9CRUS|nr:hypothetical protein OUZ56_028320 [Daphnia magna]